MSRIPSLQLTSSLSLERSVVCWQFVTSLQVHVHLSPAFYPVTSLLTFQALSKLDANRDFVTERSSHV